MLLGSPKARLPNSSHPQRPSYQVRFLFTGSGDQALNISWGDIIQPSAEFRLRSWTLRCGPGSWPVTCPAINWRKMGPLGKCPHHISFSSVSSLSLEGRQGECVFVRVAWVFVRSQTEP